MQGHETKEFRELFPDGILVLAGGVDTGLKKGGRGEHVGRLYRVVGRRNPVYMEVGMDWANMNHGDVFVLDGGKTIFVWVGSRANRAERFAGAGMAARQRWKKVHQQC